MDLQVNNLKGTIPSSLGSMTKLTGLALRANNLKGTIPSSVASMTELTYLWLDSNNLKGTIPSSVASMTKLSNIELDGNALTGLVPPLPFKQYTNGCGLDDPDYCKEPNCNHFKCPLPAGVVDPTGVHCK
jgi:Leucine-rich repeat (LRR) protein